jgi:capsular polysaccharide transport system permease protein
MRPNQPSAPVVRIGAGQKALEERRPTGAVAGASARAIPKSLPPWTETVPNAHLLLDMRHTRKLRFFARLGLFVVLPTLATLLYFLVWATPRSTSEFQVTYQTYRAPTSLSAGLVESVAGTSQSNNIDLGTILYEYIRSPALLSKLDRELDLRGYFSKPSIDYFSRLSAKASGVTFLNYYRWHISASEGLGGYVSVEVQAFDPQFAQTLAKAVVKACEEMMDDMTAPARKDEVQFAEAEVARQEERWHKARLALTEFQYFRDFEIERYKTELIRRAHGDQDPNRGAAQLGQIVGTLESGLAMARAQLANTAPTLNESSPIVIRLKSRIASLEKQLQDQQRRLAGTDQSTPYSQILAAYSALQLDEEFAKTAYTTAQQGLNVARAAARTQNFLIVFAPPNEPDKGDLTTLEYTLTVFLGSLLFFGMGSLIIGAFRDQAGI